MPTVHFCIHLCRLNGMFYSYPLYQLIIQEIPAKHARSLDETKNRSVLLLLVSSTNISCLKMNGSSSLEFAAFRLQKSIYFSICSIIYHKSNPYSQLPISIEIHIQCAAICSVLCHRVFESHHTNISKYICTITLNKLASVIGVVHSVLSLLRNWNFNRYVCHSYLQFKFLYLNTIFNMHIIHT